jgi:hypothetical protein
MKLQMRSSQSGFTLVEVIIGSGLLVVVAYFLMSFMSQQQKAVKTFDTTNEASALILQLTNILTEDESCYANFNGLAPGDPLRGISTSDTNPTICLARDQAMNCISPVLRLNELVGQTGLRVTNMEIVAPAVFTPQGVGTGTLRLTLQKENLAGGQRTTVGGNQTMRLIPFTARFCESWDIDSLTGATEESNPPASYIYTQPAFLPTEYDAESYFVSACNSQFGVTDAYLLPGSLKVLGVQQTAINPGKEWIATCLHSCGAGAPIQSCY